MESHPIKKQKIGNLLSSIVVCYPSLKKEVYIHAVPSDTIMSIIEVAAYQCDTNWSYYKYFYDGALLELSLNVNYYDLDINQMPKIYASRDNGNGKYGNDDELNFCNWK